MQTAVSAPLHLLVVDDDEQMLEAMCSQFGASYAVTTARDATEALAVPRAPDVAFVDLGLPDLDGVALVERLRARWPDVPVVVLTADRSQRRVLAAFRAGARGYVLKEDAATKLPRVVEDALAGGAPMSAGIARRILRLAAALPEVPLGADPQLTGREAEVLRALAEWGTYEQVAAILGVSLNTLRTHVRSIYGKLAVGSRTDAVVAGLQLGLLDRS